MRNGVRIELNKQSTKPFGVAVGQFGWVPKLKIFSGSTKGEFSQPNLMTERVCVAVAELRKKYHDKSIDLRKWLSDPNNLYVGRRGRIWINGEIFHYKDSEWRNDFTVKDYGRDECLKLFEVDISKKIKE